MARNYTDAEQQAAVAQIMRTSISRLYGSLGNRRTDLSFRQVQDAAIGVFTTERNAPYYVVGLAVTTVLERVNQALNTLLDLEDTVRSIDRSVRPLESVTSLANAGSALTSLSNAVESRTSALSKIQDVPAFKRFEQSTSRFLADAGPRIRSGGNIVQTPQEARIRVAGLVESAQEQHEEIIRRLELLVNAVLDFDSLALPASLSRFVTANARDVLVARHEALEALTGRERLSLLREVALDVLTVRATVRGFGALDPTLLFRYFEGGPGSVVGDVEHPVEPASLSADLPGPYVVFGPATVDFSLDGATPITVQIPESYVASVDGFLTEPFGITVASNDLFTVATTGEPDVDVSLPGGTHTAQELADEINADLGGVHPVQAFPYGPQLYARGQSILISVVAGPTATFVKATGDWNDLAVTLQVGDWLLVQDPSFPANDGWYQLTSVAGLPASFEADKESGSPVVSGGGDALADINQGPRALQLTFRDAATQQSSIAGRWFIGLPVIQDEVKQATVSTLGFIADIEIASQATKAQDIVDFVNQNPAIAPSGVPRLTASAAFETLYFQGSARSEPTDGLKVVLYNLQATTDVTNLGGTNARFSPVDSSSVSVGNSVAFRASGLNGLDNYGVVTSLGAGFFTATMLSPVTDEAGVEIEVGPDLSSAGLLFPATLRLDAEGLGLNDGEYEVTGLGGVDESGPPFEVTLARSLVSVSGLGSQALELGEAQLGSYRLVVTSTSTLLDTSVEVLTTGSHEQLFWASVPQEAVGQTPWFQVSETPRDVEVGDVLEFRDNSSQTVSFVREVLFVDTAANLLRLRTTLPTDLQSYALAQDSPAPSARVRKIRRDTYDTLKSQLDDWLSLPLSNGRKYFGDLRKRLNPLIINQNPTAVVVSDAVTKVQELLSHFTVLTQHLEGYTSPRVEPVDRLIDAYREQGADRAVDLLFEAAFSSFFRLSQDESSYNGNLQSKIRNVNMRDLPVKKTNRNPGGELIASYEELDYETDLTDTDGTELVEPAGEVYDHDGSAF